MRRAARLRRPSARLMDIKLYRTGDQRLNEARPDQGCTGTHCCSHGENCCDAGD